MAIPADKPQDFVSFMVWPRNGTMSQAVEVRIDLRKPVKLYDEVARSGYRQARARAWKIARRILGQSPSTPMRAEPHDWSDGVEALSESVSA